MKNRRNEWKRSARPHREVDRGRRAKTKREEEEEEKEEAEEEQAWEISVW